MQALALRVLVSWFRVQTFTDTGLGIISLNVGRGSS